MLYRAVEIDPDSAYAYTLLATANYAELRWMESEEYYSTARRLQADGIVLANYGNMHMRAGRSASALRLRETAAEADINPQAIGSLGALAQLANGRKGHLQAVSRMKVSFSPVARFLLALHDTDPEALRLSIEEMATQEPSFARSLGELPQMLDSPVAAVERLRAAFADKSSVWPSKYHDIALLAAYFDEPEFALDVFSVEARLVTVRYGSLWLPIMSEARKLPEFKELVTDVNLVDYWRAYGWADHCAPIGDDDFSCF